MPALCTPYSLEILGVLHTQDAYLVLVSSHQRT
jgi:hypothetical protein